MRPTLNAEAFTNTSTGEPRERNPDIVEVLGDGSSQSETCGGCQQRGAWHVLRVSCGICAADGVQRHFEACYFCGGDDAAHDRCEAHRKTHEVKQ